MTSFNYFAYGSNMLRRRLTERTPSARFQSVVTLPRHKIVFNKVSFKDGTGKCGILETDGDHDSVYGVLYEIHSSEREALDRVEGLGMGYDHRMVSVRSPETGGMTEALTYYPSNLQDGLLPYDWYKALVVEGARENELPQDYILNLEGMSAVPDADEKRAALNRRLLQNFG